MTTVDPIASHLERWRGELLDLSSRNRLLNFTFQPRSRAAFRVDHPNPDALLRALTSDSTRLPIYREDDVRYEPTQARQAPLPATRDARAAAGPRRVTRLGEILAHRWDVDFDKNLDAIRRTATLAVQETGVNVLYAVFGLLTWQEPSATGAAPKHRQAPIAMVEVALERQSRTGPFSITPLGDEVTYNQVLVEKLRRDFGLSWPGSDVDLSGQDSRQILEPLRRLVANRPGWAVTDAAYIGLLNFQKLSMFEDLDRYRHQAIGHPLVRSLIADEPLDEPAIEFITARDLDRRIDPSDTFQILPADASQREAIAAAGAGRTMIIQGPPGTGKSQTISNIIAEALAADRRVLFVSEKRAALDVVAGRLRDNDLGDLILDLHGEGAKRAEVLRELKRTIEQIDDAVGVRPGFETTIRALGAARSTLDTYVEALHRPHQPLGWSAWDAHGRLAATQDAPGVDAAIPAVGQWTSQSLEEARLLLASLARDEDLVRDPTASPWFGTLRTELSPADLTTIDHGLRDVVDAARALDQQVRDVATANDLPVPPTMRSIRQLQTLVQLLAEPKVVPHQWLAAAGAELAADLSRRLREELRAVAAQRKRLFNGYHDRVLTLNGTRLASQLSRTTELQALGLGDAFVRSLAAGADEPARVLASMRQRLTAVIEQSDALGALVGVAVPPVLADLQAYARWAASLPTERPWPPAWLDTGRLDRVTAAIAMGRAVTTRAAAARDAASDIRPESIAALDTNLAARWNSYGFLKFLSSRYRKDRETLIAARVNAGPFSDVDAQGLFDRARGVRDADQTLTAAEPSLRDTLDDRYQGSATDWDKLEGDALALRRTIEGAPDGLRPSTIRLLGEPPARITTLRDLAGRLVGNLEALAEETESLLRWSPRLLTLAGGTGTGPDTIASRQIMVERLSAPISEITDAVHLLDGARRPGPRPSIEERIATCELITSINASEERIQTEARAEDHPFRGIYRGDVAGLDTIDQYLEWCSKLRQLFAGGLIPEAFARRISGGIPITNAGARKALQTSIERFEANLAFLVTLFPLSAFNAGDTTSATVVPARVVNFCEPLIAKLPQLDQWIRVARSLKQASTLGLDDHLAACRRRNVPADDWVAAFDRRFAELWLTAVYAGEPALGAFSPVSHEQALTRFRQADVGQIGHASRRVLARQRAARQERLREFRGRGTEEAAQWRELWKYVQQTRPRRSLREIFAASPAALLTVKPCLLMSPLSVSTFLAADRFAFDLVIFDEASQVLPWDAIGAIMRARQTIIVGDANQLPPTRFFDRVGDSESLDDEAPGTFESVLELAASRLGATNQKLLRYHYRSRDESLIAFSNRQFYDDRLVTFPNAGTHEPTADLATQIERPGLHFVYQPDAIYEPGEGRRVNVGEADAAVDLLARLRRRYPTRSIGIVTLNKAQEDLVWERIQTRSEQDPAFGQAISDAPARTGADVFVKNLESVQGDEREIIILSIGYGRVRRPDGRLGFNFNFGPLSSQTGWRRLNVAITRAREQFFVLSTMHGSDISPDRAISRGATELAAFLTWAERRELPLSASGGPMVRPDHGGDTESPFEDAVAEVLTRAGYKVVPQVGVSGYRIDLGVIHPDLPGQYIMAVECDGATYHATPTARDRDRLRQTVLEGLGWRFHRVWSTSWIRERAAEEARLLAALAARVAKVQPRSTVPSSPGPATPAATSAVLVQPGTFQVYERADLDPIQSDQFLASPIRDLIQWVIAVVRVESPIHREDLVDRITAAAGLHRLSPPERDRLGKAIVLTANYGHISQEGDFLWDPGMTTLPVRGRTADGSGRLVDRIAPDEYVEAVRLLLTSGLATAYAEMVETLADRLGLDATDPGLREQISHALDYLEAEEADQNDDLPF